MAGFIIPPGKCFVAYIPSGSFVPGKGCRVSIVIEGQAGHYPTGGGDKAPWYWGDDNDEARSLREAKQTAEVYNLRRGINAVEALRIVGESMGFGKVQR